VHDTGWSEHDTISAFLTNRRRRSDTHWVSSLVAVLRDARAATGRYLATGEVSPKQRGSGSWLGVLGYMVMLDQIGECFRPADASSLPNGTPDLIKALTYFADEIPDRERQALYALRCSFAHDYSLVNIPSNRRTDRLHHFRLSEDPTPCPLVDLPAVPWDGDIARRSVSTATRVSLRRLGDVAESMYTRLLGLHSRRELSIALPGGAAELRARFAFTVYPDPPRGEP
jgi:hypothetical protein